MQELERGQSHGGGAASFSIRHPVTVCMALLALMVLGFVAITKIPLVLQPNISFPFLEVYVPYPNASPGQVLESIAKPVEEALATIPGVQRMSSFSGRDSAWINLEFGWGHNVELLRTRSATSSTRFAESFLPTPTGRVSRPGARTTSP